MRVKFRASGIHFVGRPIETSSHVHGDIRIMRFECTEMSFEVFGIGNGFDAHIDGRFAHRRHHVLGGTAGDLTNVECHATLVIRHCFDIDDLARHFEDGTAAVLMPCAGVRGPAVRRQHETRDALARCDDPAAVAGWFRHQDVFCAAGMADDDVPRSRAADFFVRSV